MPPTVDDALDLLQRTSYQSDVHVTDAVMQRVAKQPLLVPRPHSMWQRWTVAASVAVLLSVGSVAYFTSRPSDSNINTIFADVYGDADYYGDEGTICDEMAMAGWLFGE